ncbi:dihydroorotase [Vallitalea guaymasensis]|uniref:Dihydroorotase n=1 Tax=Vallitalea guaymasensis TaxID=1185412 RepID=A0A8J8SBJ3_9FIRM|nr:dihydroorotase [Vallitalea guaymasensis]QUH28391.1 dihydroorotase [Vallitalea guaymasensis]
MKLLIKNGTIINPKEDLVKKLDLLIEDDVIVKIQEDITCEADEIIDAEGLWVTPGLIDVHVHLREPGYEHKETIATGSKSAAAGGFTTICAMPNTNPAIDTKELVEMVKQKAEKEAVVNVLPIGAITLGQNGEQLVDIEAMSKAGICAISEDGKSVMDAKILNDAMIQAEKLNIPVLSHCEDANLAKTGIMNEGIANKLGVEGIPPESEDIIVSRDIILAGRTGARLHICHISTKESIDFLRNAKESGLNVSAEVCPHHYTLTEEDVTIENTNTKMNPPLRSKKDVEAVKEALRDGVIEIIATDHAPHHIDEKNQGYEKAPNGIVGLETAVALGITELVETEILTPLQLIRKMSYNPAKMLGIDKGTLENGKIADITIINPTEEYEIDVNRFHSKSKNSPFHGKHVKGKVKYTIVNGKVVFK